MKKSIRYILFIMLLPLFVVTACKKSSSNPEDKLDVSLSAANIETVPSSSYDLKVTVKSRMPAAGVTIKIDVKREDNSAPVYNVQATSAFASVDFTISPLPPGQVYTLATVTVTSLSTPSNVWTGTFRLLWK